MEFLNMRCSRFSLFLLSFFSLVSISIAQTATTSLRGIVTDKTGAIISGVDVTITEKSIGFSQMHKTNEKGEYSFQQIPPGSYQIRMTFEGFSEQVIQTQLLVNQPATVNGTLLIGSSATLVDVTAESTGLNATDATIGTPFNQTEIQSLPFTGNNVFSLLSLQAGVLTLGDQSTTTMDSDSRAGSVNGARSDQSNLTLDGLDNNTQTQGYAFTGVLRPTRDSVEEFRVVTTGSNADSGRSSGAQVSVVTRSGTNKMHGSAYEYYRPTNTVANGWFIKQSQLASGEANIPPKYLRNTFGASLGGPILKDKLFYFASYEADKIAQSQQVTDEVPLGTAASPALRQGFVSYTNAQGGTTTLSPSQIAQMDPNCSSLGTCPLGAGVDPAALAYFAALPQANGNLLGDGLNFGSYTFSSPYPISNITNIVKLDYNLNAKQRLFFRGNLDSDNTTGLVQYPGGSPSVQSYDNSKGIGVGHTWTITDSMVNNLRYGYIRQGFANRGATHGDYVNFANITPVTATSTDLVVNVPVNNLIDDLSWTKKAHTIQVGFDYRLIHNNRQGSATAFNNAQVQYYSLGAGAIANTGNSLDPGAFGFPAVNSNFGSAYSSAIAAVAGVIPVATEYFNYHVDGNSLTPIAHGQPLTRSFKSNEFEIYVQDSWKMTRDLTITYGIRYTSLQTPYEVNGQEVAPSVSLNDWFNTRKEKMLTGVTDQPDISFAGAGHAHNAPGLWAKDRLDFAPRFAIAYSPTNFTGVLGKIFGEGLTSIRGGFGIYYDHFGQGIIDTFDAEGAYGLSSRVNSPIDLTPDQAPRFSSTTSVPTQIIPPTPAESTFPVTPGDIEALTWGVDNRVKTPYAEAMDFSIQRQVSKSWTFEAAYVGRLGKRLLQNLDLATPLDLTDPKSGSDWFRAAQAMSAARVAGTSTASMQAIPYFENMFPLAAGGGLTATQNIYNDLWTSGTVGNETFPLYTLDNGYYPGSPNGQLNRYFAAQYASLYAWATVGTSSYHSMQLSLHHTMSQGLQFDFNYTLAKSSDLGSDAERADFNQAQTFSSIVNAFNIRGNRGVSDFDTRHAIAANFDYKLPFGRGAAFASSTNPIVNALISNWGLSGLTHWTSGLPFSGIDGAGWSTDWAVQSFALNTGKIASGGHHITDGEPNAFPNQTAALANITAPFAGQTGQRNAFRGDGYFSIDSSLAKVFSIFESQTLKFQWDVFNTTNSVRFDPASVQNNPFNAGSFGVYSKQLVAPRAMQFSLRYGF
jgi:Carboxypeptidase regulatory-like domain